MSNEFKRVPTCGENDVDLRVATEPRRVTDAVLPQIIAAKDGEIAALTAEVTHLAEKLAERDAKAGSVLTDAQIVEIARIACVEERLIWAGFDKDADGKYTVPVLSPSDFKLVRAVLAASAPSVDRNSVLQAARGACLATAADQSPEYSVACYACAQAIQELIWDAAPQPVDAAQAVPEMSHSQLTELARKACADGRLNWAGFRIDSDDRYTIPVISQMEYNLVLLALAATPSPAAQPAAQAVPGCFIEFDGPVVAGHGMKIICNKGGTRTAWPLVEPTDTTKDSK